MHTQRAQAHWRHRQSIIEGPWDFTVHDEGNKVKVFVSNVLTGTVSRLDLALDGGNVVVQRSLKDHHGAVSIGEIERRARNLWGEAFEDRTSVGALRLPDGSARMFAARKVNAILFETMRDPLALISPRGCREVENAVLDTLLSSG